MSSVEVVFFLPKVDLLTLKTFRILSSTSSLQEKSSLAAWLDLFVLFLTFLCFLSVFVDVFSVREKKTS